ADNIKGALGEKIRTGREMAIMSKKLATIITDVPVEFHEEDFRVKEWNKEILKEVFTELEFKTVGRRLLGDDFGEAPGTRRPAASVQTDLFGAPVSNGNISGVQEEVTESTFTQATANITNT